VNGSDLVGAWHLESFHDVHGGTLSEGPLGPAPTGLLIYSADGHVAVTMAGTGFMSYAGSWHRDGDRVLHTISVAPEATWAGSVQVRDLRLSGDRLVLSGCGPSGSPVRRELTWRRAA
jgi:hypothetical protein